MFVVRIFRVFWGLLFGAIYGMGSGWDGFELAGALADEPSPAGFSLILCSLFVFFFSSCFCYSVLAFLFLIGATLFILTITELDEGQS